MHSVLVFSAVSSSPVHDTSSSGGVLYGKCRSWVCPLLSCQLSGSRQFEFRSAGRGGRLGKGAQGGWWESSEEQPPGRRAAGADSEKHRSLIPAPPPSPRSKASLSVGGLAFCFPSIVAKSACLIPLTSLVSSFLLISHPDLSSRKFGYKRG